MLRRLDRRWHRRQPLSSGRMGADGGASQSRAPSIAAGIRARFEPSLLGSSPLEQVQGESGGPGEIPATHALAGAWVVVLEHPVAGHEVESVIT